MPGPKIDYFQKLKDASDAADKLRDTGRIFQSKAFVDAALGTIVDESGNIDYSLLDQPDKRVELTANMGKYMRGAAVEFFNSSTTDPMKQELLNMELFGFSEGELYGNMDNLRKQFTLEAYMSDGMERLAALNRRMVNSTLLTIPGTPEAKRGILKGMGLEGKIDNIDTVTMPAIASLLPAWKEYGTVPRQSYSQIPGFKKS